ncbi:uncharacterized protein [Diadema antillarum]|uniref:uncharacterized protein n=2 Tax=Diadema antillarum TaxID=105358 RepID=UPI003A89189E
MAKDPALVSCLLFCVLLVFPCMLLLSLAQSSDAAAVGGSADHECTRECEWPPAPKHCRYNFSLEWYYSMSKACYGCPSNLTDCSRPQCIPLNGVPRPITVVNRMFPGPAVEVCKGDTIEVNVYNHMINGEGASIHWHGFPQRNTPYMDGVSMVTQCPITEFTSFTYEMVAEHRGTHWWHGHSGMHRADGVFGALIVREPAQADPHSDLFDHDLPEHVLLVHDWLDSPTLDKFAAHHFDNGSNKPESVLINGKGRRAAFFDDETNTTLFTAREIFHVRQGHRYRFRVISNAITNAALKISVDGHNLTLIASDGGDIHPVPVDAFVIYGGERFDFVLDANEVPGNYWLRVKGLADAKFVQELAVIRYEGAPNEDPREPEDFDRDGIILQNLNEPASETVYTIDEMVSIDNEVIPQENKVTHYIAFDFYKVNNYNFHDPILYPIEDISSTHHLYSPQLNHVSFKFAPAPPLTQSADIPAEDLCEASDVLNMAERCTEEYCECTHVITVQLGQTVELILIDEGVTFDASHPFHMHGYSFHVVGQDRLNGTGISIEEVIELDKAGLIVRNLDRPPIKDTVIVPDGGYTIVQFVADNPGWWFFHCHLEFHVAIGMGLLVHVGTDADLPPAPDNFPRCGNWPFAPSFSTEQPATSPTGNGAHATLSPFAAVCAVCVWLFSTWLHGMSR